MDLCTKIDGVALDELRVIPTSGGPVLHMLRVGSENMPVNIGEVYFSEVNPGQVKAWKCHLRQTQRFAVPVGRLHIVLYDARPDSPTRGRLEDFVLGRPEAYFLLCIPPGVWYGFSARGDCSALICNCPDLPHDPAEALRLAPDAAEIPWHWGQHGRFHCQNHSPTHELPSPPGAQRHPFKGFMS